METSSGQSHARGDPLLRDRWRRHSRGRHFRELHGGEHRIEPDSHSHADADTDTDANTNADANADANTYFDTNAYTHADGYAQTETHAQTAVRLLAEEF